LWRCARTRFSEGFLYGFKVYFREPSKDTVLAVPVGEESVQVRMIVKSLTSRLYGEDSGEFSFV
jgi:hypothetical protein